MIGSHFIMYVHIKTLCCMSKNIQWEILFTPKTFLMVPQHRLLLSPCLLLSCFLHRVLLCSPGCPRICGSPSALPFLCAGIPGGAHTGGRDKRMRSLKSASAAWNLASEKLFKKQRILLTFTEYNFFFIVLFGEG